MDTDHDPKIEARRKLIGRAIVVGFAVLVAIYVAATFWPH